MVWGRHTSMAVAACGLRRLWQGDLWAAPSLIQRSGCIAEPLLWQSLACGRSAVREGRGLRHSVCCSGAFEILALASGAARLFGSGIFVLAARRLGQQL